MLEFICNSYVFVCSVFIREQAKINQYDPYQVDQLKSQFNFNPYHTEQVVAKMTEIKRPVYTKDEEEDDEKSCDESMVIINKGDEKDCNESMVMIDKRNHNNVRIQDEAESYFKIIHTLATHALIYSVIIAYQFISTERFLPVQSSIKPEKKMRGFGIDFGPSVGRPAAIEFRIKHTEKEVREIFENNGCLQVQKSSAFPFKTWDDHEWGFIEKDYNVYYKVYQHIQLTRDIITYNYLLFSVGKLVHKSIHTHNHLAQKKNTLLHLTVLLI